MLPAMLNKVLDEGGGGLSLSPDDVRRALEIDLTNEAITWKRRAGVSGPYYIGEYNPKDNPGVEQPVCIHLVYGDTKIKTRGKEVAPVHYVIEAYANGGDILVPLSTIYALKKDAQKKAGDFTLFEKCWSSLATFVDDIIYWLKYKFR